MKLEYREYGCFDKEDVIKEALGENRKEFLRLMLNKTLARRVKDRNVSTLHEFILGRCEHSSGVIVVDEVMYPDGILGAFLMSLNDTDEVLFIHDRNKQALDSSLINRIKAADGVLEDFKVEN